MSVAVSWHALQTMCSSCHQIHLVCIKRSSSAGREPAGPSCSDAGGFLDGGGGVVQWHACGRTCVKFPSSCHSHQIYRLEVSSLHIMSLLSLDSRHVSLRGRTWL